MEKMNANSEIKKSIDEQTNDNLSESFFMVSSEDEIPFYVAGILDISDDVFKKGADFLKKNRSFAILADVFFSVLSYVKSHNRSAFTFMLEENYVDMVYRDSYYFYFSGKHFCYDRFCKRIFLYANTYEEPLLDLKSNKLNEDFVGSIVIRPIQDRAIGRTLLNPKYFIDKNFVRTAEYNMMAFGRQFSIKAFPYSMQDTETTTCAEITILNLMDYFSHSYPEYHYLLPSDINRIAEENGYERSLPTHGLKYEMISKAFCESGFYPRLYLAEKMPKDKFRRILYYYIESGIPLSIGVTTGRQNRHSIVVIGHGKLNLDQQLKQNIYGCYDKRTKNTTWICDAADAVEDFCIMDDLRAPYMMSKCSLSEKKLLKLGDDYNVETMLVPLYKKMYLEASGCQRNF